VSGERQQLRDLARLRRVRDRIVRDPAGTMIRIQQVS
jgi:hypothetical protein